MLHKDPGILSSTWLSGCQGDKLLKDKNGIFYTFGSPLMSIYYWNKIIIFDNSLHQVSTHTYMALGHNESYGLGPSPLQQQCFHSWALGPPGGSSGEEPAANAGDIRDTGSIPGWGRSPGGRHGHPCQDSCLENPMDGGAWWATVQRVAQSRIRLRDLARSHSHPEAGAGTEAHS